MAKLTSLQADKQIYDIGASLIDELGNRLGYEVYVSYPGIDPPKRVNDTTVYVRVERSQLSKDNLGVEADSGFITTAEVRYMIYATEKKTDFAICNDMADKFAQTFSRRRCGDSLVIKSGRWEDLVESYGRRVYTIIITYEYES